MNITEFNRLENDLQIELVWQKGEIVSSRVEGYYKYLLLQLYSFYVEIRFDTRINVLEFETHSVNAYQIEPYLEKINIDWLLEHDIIPVIPPHHCSQQPREYDRWLYRERHLIECLVNKLKQFRRIFSRFDKLATRYLGFIHFASALIWLR